MEERFFGRKTPNDKVKCLMKYLIREWFRGCVAVFPQFPELRFSKLELNPSRENVWDSRMTNCYILIVNLLLCFSSDVLGFISAV